ncbi:MAG: TetR/AcrR family transcriptional regulator [Novosphingobium sp.]
MASLSDRIANSENASHAEETPDRARLLVSAAYELLETDGLEGLTIRAVLKRTGLARRAFYERFAGKDDLVLAVFEQTLQEAARYFRELAEDLGDPEEQIRLVVKGIALRSPAIDKFESGDVIDKRSAALSREHLRLAESRPAELQAALSPLLDLITEIVAAGIEAGRFRPCDPAMQATLIYNLVSTTIHTELLAEEGGAPDEKRRQILAEEIWEFCRRAIAA